MYHWLITEGSLYPALVAFAVGVLGGWVLGLRRAWRRHLAVQLAQLTRLARIHEQLDTQTPGGLTDVVDAIKEDKR